MGCEIGFEVYITLILMRRYERWTLSQKLKVRQRELHVPDSIPKPSAKSTAARVRERAQKVPAIFGATSLETLGHTTDEFMHMMPNSAPRTASEWGEPASREWHTRII